jgi:hypothetical protein
MKKFFYLYFLAFLFTLYSVTYSQTTNLSANTNELIELTYTSSIIYNNPPVDITIECLIFKQSDSLRVLGFWDGDNIYKIRFSLPISGEWNFITYCSDLTNTKLHNQTGKITVSNYNGNNILYKKGPIKVSPNKIYLVYNDGDPFFYLGDIACEITWKSYKEQIYQYISNRKNKGFTTIEAVALSHQFFCPYGVQNRYNETSFLNNDYSNINPKYFSYLDFIVKTANDSGLIVMLVPLWAHFSEVNNLPHLTNYLNIEESLNLAKYLGARYSGFQVMWIIAGDAAYDTEIRKQFWSSFANIIKKSSGNAQLCTCHPNGWRNSFDFFDDSKYSWLDFHMYHSSHMVGGYWTWYAAEKGMHINIPKPVLNGEPNFEDIIDAHFWDDEWAYDSNFISANNFRVKTIDVRQASYESILNGARVGIAYGGNGVWQWHSDDEFGTYYSTHLPRLPVLEAINMPGASNMTILKNLMEKYKWYSFTPKPKYISSFNSQEKFTPIPLRISISENDDVGIIYIPKNTSYISLNAYSFNKCFSFYINPSTGDSIPRGYISSTERLFPPDTSDWILIVDKKDYKDDHKFDDSNMKTLNENIKFYNPYPNPFNLQTTITFSIGDPCFISIKIYNTLGKEVYSSVNKYYNSGFQYFTLPAKNSSSGTYFYRIESDNNYVSGKIVLVK